MLQTETSHLWKVRYAIILLGWWYITAFSHWFIFVYKPLNLYFYTCCLFPFILILHLPFHPLSFLPFCNPYLGAMTIWMRACLHREFAWNHKPSVCSPTTKLLGSVISCVFEISWWWWQIHFYFVKPVCLMHVPYTCIYVMKDNCLVLLA